MIQDRVRTEAYARALRECITPDSVVLDMGTGVGIWALLACQFGARKVYAVDPNEVIQVAREFARANGYADRIQFIQDMTTRISLPEPADLIVTEMHGVLPMFEQNIASIIDARRRLLAPGGRMIPEKETVWAVPIESVESYDHLMLPWSRNPFGLDLQRAIKFVVNQWRRSKSRIAPEQFLAKPAGWATLDYRTLEEVSFIGRAEWTADRTGTGHGVLVWFDTTLVDGVSFSTGPEAPEIIFGNGFFPWSKPVSISAGDTISVELRADLFDDDYVWSWETVVLEQGSAERVKARFKQSTFLGVTVSPTMLHKRANDYIPRLNEDGRVEQFALALMDGENSLEEIAGEMAERFSDRFVDAQDALNLVGDLSQRCSG